MPGAQVVIECVMLKVLQEAMENWVGLVNSVNLWLSRKSLLRKIDPSQELEALDCIKKRLQAHECILIKKKTWIQVNKHWYHREITTKNLQLSKEETQWKKQLKTYRHCKQRTLQDTQKLITLAQMLNSSLDMIH